jgi:hypothetical protein
VANNVYQLCNSGVLVKYLHKAIFSPKKSALLQAVKNGHLATWPGLTEQAINKHLKMTPETHGTHEPTAPEHVFHFQRLNHI